MQNNMLIFSTLAGSRLYGYNKVDSDFDYRGVFLAPKAQVLGLDSLTEVIDSIAGNIDTVNYELRKFAKLALKGNPNILEILFSTKGVYNTEYWARLYNVRYDFLSQQIRAPYSGFLLSEIKKLEKKYEPKAAANAWRIAVNGITILVNGDFNPSFEPGLANQMRRIREGEESPALVMDTIRVLDTTLQNSGTSLPMYPNTKRISDIVVSIYEDYYNEPRQSNSEW